MISFKSLIFQFVIGPLLKGKATFKSTIVGEKNDPKIWRNCLSIFSNWARFDLQ